MNLPELIAGMRESLKKATPGPWKAVSVTVESERGYVVAKTESTPALDGRSLYQRNCDQAEFIALANPENLLRVLDRIQELEKALVFASACIRRSGVDENSVGGLADAYRVASEALNHEKGGTMKKKLLRGSTEMTSAQGEAEKWVFEDNGHLFSNNNDEAANATQAYLAGYRQAIEDAAQLVERLNIEESKPNLGGTFGNTKFDVTLGAAERSCLPACIRSLTEATREEKS